MSDCRNRQGSTNLMALHAPTLDQTGVPRRIPNTPQVSTQEVSETVHAPALHACLQRGRIWDVLILEELPKLFHSLYSSSHVPGAPVPELSSPRAWRVTANPGKLLLAFLTPPGCGAGAGPTAEPPPTASPASQAGGLLGRLHLLFLKQRGADERHHWSPGPSHRHTQRPALRSRSSSRGGGNSGRGHPKGRLSPRESRSEMPTSPPLATRH